MTEQQVGAVTRMLQCARDGDAQAVADLSPLIYSELRRLARALMSKTPPGNTLQPTALVHEAYLRLVGSDDPGWDCRGHFFGAAAQAMRDILVEQTRRKASVKRGGGRKRVELEHNEPKIEPPAEDLLALDEALKQLEKFEPRRAKVVMLRYFAGLTAEETAAALGISVRTANRDWRFSRTFLYDFISSPEPRT